MRRRLLPPFGASLLVLASALGSSAALPGERSNMRPLSPEAMRAARERLENHRLDKLESCKTLVDSLRAVLGPDYLERAGEHHSSPQSAVRALVLAITKPPLSQVAAQYYKGACWPEVEPDLLAHRWDAGGSLVTIQVLEVLREDRLDLEAGSELTLPCYYATTSNFYFEPVPTQCVYPQAELFAVLHVDPLCPSTLILGDLILVGERGSTHWIRGSEALHRLYSVDPTSVLAAQSGEKLPRSP